MRKFCKNVSLAVNELIKIITEPKSIRRGDKKAEQAAKSFSSAILRTTKKVLSKGEFPGFNSRTSIIVAQLIHKSNRNLGLLIA